MQVGTCVRRCYAFVWLVCVTQTLAHYYEKKKADFRECKFYRAYISPFSNFTGKNDVVVRLRRLEHHQQQVHVGPLVGDSVS